MSTNEGLPQAEVPNKMETSSAEIISKAAQALNMSAEELIFENALPLGKKTEQAIELLRVTTKIPDPMKASAGYRLEARELSDEEKQLVRAALVLE
jgi:hypothetical protein